MLTLPFRGSHELSVDKYLKREGGGVPASAPEPLQIERLVWVVASVYNVNISKKVGGGARFVHP